MREKLKIQGDILIWAVAILLLLIGMVAVYSTSSILEHRNELSEGSTLTKQIIISIVGIVIIYVSHRINYTVFSKFAPILFLISFVLLGYTMFFGTSINQGARWVKIPGIGLTIQASDFAKLSLYIYLAKTLSLKRKEIKSLKKGFLPLIVPIALICCFIAFENLSTAILVGVTSCVILFIGRINVFHIFGLIISMFFLLLLVFFLSKATGIGRATTWEARITNFMNKDENKYEKDENFQITQAAIAIVRGGIIGKGPGNSWAKEYLPESYSDFVYAIIIEEYGLIGGIIVILLYLMFLWRSILIFRKTPYAFGAFLALGLSTTLVMQAFFNMAVAVQLFPVTGLTLPLISKGGSSVVFTSIAIGIILSVSRNADELEIKYKNRLEEEKAEENKINEEKRSIEKYLETGGI